MKYCMFSKLDHVHGAIMVRILNIFLILAKKPDLNFFLKDVSVGGSPNLELIKKFKINAILDLRAEKGHEQKSLEKHGV